MFQQQSKLLRSIILSLSSHKVLTDICLVLIGTIILAVSAKIKIPMYPVPITMQSFVVIMLGVLYGQRLALITISTYIFEGVIGLPVFANSDLYASGLSYLLSPTGGYLIGFLASVMSVNFLVNKGWGETVWSACGILATGLITIDIVGLCWLGNLLGMQKAYAIFLMYLPSSLLKIGLGSVILPLIINKRISGNK